MKISPAELLKNILTQNSLLTEVSAKAAWPCFVAHMPDAETIPDNAACIFDTSPILDGRYMRTGESVEHPGNQILIRSFDYKLGWNKLQDIGAYCDSLYRVTQTVDDYQYTIQNISTGGILSLGLEDGSSKRRFMFTLNTTMTVVFQKI